MSDPSPVFDMLRRVAEASHEAPLTGVDPNAITRAFEADPLTLADSDLALLSLELRRRRNAFMAKEAAAAAQGRTRRPPAEPQTSAQSALLDKPPEETSLSDLLD